MEEFFRERGCSEERARAIVRMAGANGYGVTVRGDTVTVYAPPDGEDPLPWGASGHDMMAQLRGWAE